MASGSVPLIRVPGLTLCRAMYTRKHLPLFAAEMILHEPLHPLYPQTRQRYEARTTSTLWWNVTSNTMSTNTKKVVRSWINRRLRRAVVEALRANGFDAEGRLAGGEDGDPRPGIKGTLVVHAQSAAQRAKFVQLKTQIELIVKEIRRQQR